jgi:plasmid stabilization system protein ParE
MTYLVRVSDQARSEIDRAFAWWAENRSREQAVKWYNGILASIESLGGNPDRCALARESERFPYEIRELHFGLGSRPTHRVVFTIRRDTVVVLTVRHAAQADISLEDV